MGILGGGQLGRMLVQAGTDLNVQFKVLDPSPQAPCSSLVPDFHVGALTDYDTVLAFGKDCQVLTIEIENVNTDALKELARKGVKVFPQPEVIALIQDKRLQKQFYQQKGIPTASFVLTQNRQEVATQHAHRLPAVHKLGREGYDGRGVQVLRTAQDLPKAFDAPGVLEELVDFEKEIAIIVSRNEAGQVSAFPAVEMVFHPEANLVEFLLGPARLSEAIAQQAKNIAIEVIEALDMVGLLAVEMFITKQGQVLVNEVAPRPHNSGHHTIEASYTSQYHQHLRAIMGLPPGHTQSMVPAVMVNLLGAPGHSGPALYQGMEAVLVMPGTHVHLYGKAETRPFRKMGHVTLTGPNAETLLEKAQEVKQTLKVIA